MGNEIKPPTTILIVDDDVDLVHIINYKLKLAGFQTQISLNGAQIRDIIAQSLPDIILLDIHMDGVDGGDICKEIKCDPATCSIIVLLFSANDNIKAIRDECGADGFVTKPFEDDVLIKTIHHHLDARAAKALSSGSDFQPRV